jgi:hypothetical protein
MDWRDNRMFIKQISEIDLILEKNEGVNFIAVVYPVESTEQMADLIADHVLDIPTRTFRKNNHFETTLK